MFFDRFLIACNKIKKSPSKVALEIGASKSNITNWKNGASPSADIIRKASTYLGISSDYLLGLSDYMTFKEEAALKPITKDRVNQEALEVYRNLSDCMQLFKRFYSDTLNESENKEVRINKLLCQYLNLLIENYQIIANDLINKKSFSQIIIDATISEPNNLELLMEEILNICDKIGMNKKQDKEIYSLLDLI